MKPILRATAILGSSSMVTIAMGLISSKAWAILLGPDGLGFMGLLQSVVGLSGLIAGMGVGVGLVRMAAGALARDEQMQVAALRRAAWLLALVLGSLAVLVLAVLRVPISRWMLGGEEHAGYVVLMGAALMFSLATGIQTSTLNAYHRVGALAKISVLTSVIGTTINVTMVWLWRIHGIVPAIIAAAGVQCAIAHYFVRRELREAPASRSLHPPRREVLKAARSLLRFGLPYTASMVVGAGVQFVLPVLVLNRLGTENVGFFKAATTVSVSYLGFLLTAMSQDYYPRVAAAGDQADTLVHLVNQQHRLVMMLAVPMILGTLALAPYLIPLVYSAKFAPTVEVLEWQLIGDLFKFSSWTMSFIILTRSGSSTYFFMELVGGATTLLLCWLGMSWFGLAGLGIGFLGAYLVYYVLVSVIVRREIPLVWSGENKLLLLLAILAAVVIRSLPFVGLETLRTPLALSFAMLAGLASIYTIRREMGRDGKVVHGV